MIYTIDESKEYEFLEVILEVEELTLDQINELFQKIEDKLVEISKVKNKIPNFCKWNLEKRIDMHGKIFYSLTCFAPYCR